MNLCDCTVITVDGPPVEKYGKWFLPVTYGSWGSTSETELMFNTKEQAAAVRPGYDFLA